ncbi:MAG: exodeoxyribonuclease VII large subunit [Anaerolineales bacterium]|nr:exodeoxyribonuclease VII large subunit [Anaerolineales bacterium]MCB0019808.1 exodeoxyribonuclease VII large subunit [Anaerolineales bacterium]MCB0028358.1 exodeoxyribonuclease VII large subunit [Anaerolineales bacterium]MCB8962701.1 exodeoxyribonuclease VII large subunit [Ardenticatenales bacterium]
MGWLKQSDTQGSSWTVSELTAYIRELFDIDFRLREVEIQGEISNFSRARSGHLYFTLKDEGAQLKCVMWRSAADRLRFDPGDGDAVVARGRIGVYEASGVYQLYADGMEPAGRGNLALEFERLKAQLDSEGLFDPDHKQPIPALPQKIGIVTSADAAALQDILNVLRRRYPLVAVLIAPTLVQGATAPPQIVRALQWLDGRNDIDTIIVARGGGSIEDLWAFNDERVARAIFAAQHPIISGVGHEIDFTIADFVADLRAPTPSAAAELAVPDIAEIKAAVAGTGQLLDQLMLGQLQECRRALQIEAQRLHHLRPQNRIDSWRQLLDGQLLRLDNAMNNQLAAARHQLALLQTELRAVSPQATLDRGFAIIQAADGTVIRSVAQVQPGQPLNVQVADGRFGASVAAEETIDE